jgi:TonB family protein
MTRRWLIPVSIAAHAGLGIFLFATGVWRLERLEPGRVDVALGVMLPPSEPEGGPPPGQKPKDAVKKDKDAPVKKKPDEIVQPEKKLETAPVPAVVSTEIGAGSGSGSGSGTGSGTGSGSGSGSGSGFGSCIGNDCIPGEIECGNGIVETGETCDDSNTLAGDGCSAVCKKEVVLVPPTVLQGLRISGETQIQAPDPVKTEMLRDGKDRTIGTLKLCIATDGGISSVSIVGSTKYPAYDAKLVSTARTWRYKAYTVNGRPMPVCSTVTFVYTIK